MTNLEQLLEEIRGPRTGEEKLASPTAPVGDLISRLLKHASDDGTGVEVRDAARQELIEKTARIRVIGLTLAEIDQACAAPGVKTASAAVVTDAHLRRAAHIKVALEKGYSEREIAEYLQKRAGAAAVAKDIGKGLGESSHTILTGIDKAWHEMTPGERKRAVFAPIAGVGGGVLGSLAANRMSRKSRED